MFASNHKDNDITVSRAIQLHKVLFSLACHENRMKLHDFGVFLCYLGYQLA